MHFAQPIHLYALFLVGGLALFFLWQRTARKKQIGQFAEDHLSGRLVRRYNPKRENARILLVLVGFFFLILALGRPQWGSRWEQMKRRGLDILIALDVSKSMLSEDVKPNRLERSKLAIKDFVRKLNGDRVGLIVFAGDAYLACPLTSDYAGFNLTLDDVSVGSVGQGGTNIPAAIREAMRATAAAAGPHKILVLITDGENHEGDPAEEAQKARKEHNIHIYTVGVGTSEGELVPMKEGDGQSGFLKDQEGLVVKSRLDEAILEKITEVSDGLYVRSTPTEFGLDTLYQKPLSRIEKQVYENKAIALHEERFQIFLLIAFILFILENILAQNYYERRP